MMHKIAGHRLGNGLESAFVSHKSIAEAAVTSMPDEKKGESIIAFVALELAFQYLIIYVENLLITLEML